MPGKSDFIDMGIVSIGLFLMIAAAKIVPEGALQTFFIVVGFLIVVGDTVFVEFAFEMITRHYPYVRIELQPSGVILHGFLEERPLTIPLSKTLNATRLVFHWPLVHSYYGKFKECVIHHELAFWGTRVVPGPGWAVFQGYAIKHAMVARLVCHEYEYSSDRWKDLSRPAFALAYAHGGDVELVPLPLTSVFRAIFELVRGHPELLKEKFGSSLSMKKILSFGRHYAAMVFAYGEKNREAQYYRSQLLRYQGGEESRDSQSKGLLEIPRDTTKRGLELVHGWYTECGAFDRIIQKYGKPQRWRMSKWTGLLGIAIVSALTIGFLAYNPETSARIGNWMSKLQNQILLAIIALCIVTVLFLIKRKKQ